MPIRTAFRLLMAGGLLLCSAGTVSAQRGTEPAELAGLSGPARVDRIAELVQARRDSNPAAGLDLAEEGLELARRLRYMKGEADLLTGAGVMLNLAGRRDEAFDRYRDAIALYRGLEAPAELADALRSMGITLYDRALYDEAAAHYLEALEISERIGDVAGAARSAANLGNVYRMTGQPLEALMYQQRALAGFESVSDTLGVSAVAINTGVLQSALGADRLTAGDTAGYLEHVAASRASYERALAGFEAIGNPRGIASATHNLGGVYRRLGDLAEAQRLQRQAYALYEAMGNEGGQVEALVALGMTLRDAGQPAESLARLREALQRAQAGGDRSILAGIYNELSLTYESLGDHRAALAALRQHAALRDQESRERMEARIAQLSAQANGEKAEREIASLRADQQAQSLAIFRHRAIIGMLAGGVTIVVLLLALIYSRYRAGARVTTHLDQVSRTDPLTGLPNRRDLIDRIEVERIRAVREGVPFAIVLGDLDDFKSINDTYGHDAGDHVLIHAGARLRSVLRGSDFAGRWGGEEFLAVLPGTRLAAALMVAERMREALEAVPAEWNGVHVHVTVTVGVAVFDSETTLDECVRAADQALRTGKRRGKNRVLAIGA